MKHYLCFNFQSPLGTGKLCTYSNISQTDNYFVVLISRAHQGPGNHIIIKYLNQMKHYIIHVLIFRAQRVLGNYMII